MKKLSELPNIGKVLEKNLNAIGINTVEEFQARDTIEIFMTIRLHQDSGACLHMLYGIEGAKEGINYSLLSNETKEELKKFYYSLEK